MISNFADFCQELQACGFSMGGGNAKGTFALIPYDWLGQEELNTPVKWHTGDPDTDPWEWRMRVLEERDDIAYAKVFFKTSGYITRAWYPHFYAVRRRGESFDEAYENGRMSHAAKRIYTLLTDGAMPLHEIKVRGGFGKADKAMFDRALIELQMGMFITITGRRQKKNQYGLDYGWNSTVLCTVEDFWAERDLSLEALDPQESYDMIRDQLLRLNPAAEEKTIRKFIMG